LRTDIASGIAFRNGAVYITGVDGGDLPVTTGAFQTKCHMTSGRCDYDAFISKISFPLAPAVLPNPRAISFGRVIVGTTTTAVPLSITNQGTATLDISTIALSSTTGFMVSNKTCGATLAAGASCGMKIAAKPPTNICCFSNVVITDNAMISPQIVPLSVTAAYDSVSPASLTFAAQKVGTLSTAQNITITNHASTSFTFTFAVINSNDFGISSNPCGTIAAGKSCVIGVVFHPERTGSRSGSINITDNGHDPGFVVNLTGTGQ
jgi:hypothetical protein